MPSVASERRPAVALGRAAPDRGQESSRGMETIVDPGEDVAARRARRREQAHAAHGVGLQRLVAHHDRDVRPARARHLQRVEVAGLQHAGDRLREPLGLGPLGLAPVEGLDVEGRAGAEAALRVDRAVPGDPAQDDGGRDHEREPRGRHRLRGARLEKRDVRQGDVVAARRALLLAGHGVGLTLAGQAVPGRRHPPPGEDQQLSRPQVDLQLGPGLRRDRGSGRLVEPGLPDADRATAGDERQGDGGRLPVPTTLGHGPPHHYRRSNRLKMLHRGAGCWRIPRRPAGPKLLGMTEARADPRASSRNDGGATGRRTARGRCGPSRRSGSRRGAGGGWPGRRPRARPGRRGRGEAPACPRCRRRSS